MQTEKKYFNSTDARNLIQHYGFALFPIHGVVDGKCTCGNPDCANIGKHPATSNGLTDATKDIDTLAALWNRRKGLNVGIATGAASGIFVIDIDGEQGEKDILEHGQLPATLAAKTGRGRHLFFKHPGVHVKTRTRLIGQKVDVRGDGGYVAGVGSNHASGSIYEWVNPLENIAEAPKWLLDIVTKEKLSEIAAPPQINTPRLFVSNSWQESDVIDMLRYISPDIGYDEWIKVGMAIQSEGFGFHVWDNWSRGSSAKYQQAAMGGHWKSFKPGHGVSFGTLVKMAQNGGWGRKVTPSLARVTPLLAQVDPVTGEVNRLTYKWINADDVKAVLEIQDFVENTLRDHEMSVVYGKPGCGKTFFMVDLAMHVALGRKWNGLEVEQGAVVYVSMEGAHGMKNRVHAFRSHHGVEGKIPLYIIPQAFSMFDQQIGLQGFLNTLEDIKTAHGGIRLIVIDTLARAMAGGDENSTKDMSLFVSSCDIVRAASGAHMSIVHHSGKDELKGGRGSSALLGGIDTEIELSRDEDSNIVTVTTTKQKEMELGKKLYYSISAVTLGVNKRGKSVTSCVVNPVPEGEVTKTKDTREMSPKQKFVFDVIVNQLAISGQKIRPYSDGPELNCISYEDLNSGLEEAGVKRMLDSENGKSTAEDKVKSFTQSGREQLKKMGKIGFNKRYVWLIE